MYLFTGEARKSGVDGLLRCLGTKDYFTLCHEGLEFLVYYCITTHIFTTMWNFLYSLLIVVQLVFALHIAAVVSESHLNETLAPKSYAGVLFVSRFARKADY